jgi:hypothetical protein
MLNTKTIRHYFKLIVSTLNQCLFRLKNKLRIALLGGGPSALFMLKQFVDVGDTNLLIDIYEKKDQLGAGMPYSPEGAKDEHITNTSGNEIPELATPVADWVKIAPEKLEQHFNITPETYNDYKVLPRLFFGQYLKAQFNLLREKAMAMGILGQVHFNTSITDIIDYPDKEITVVEINGEQYAEYDCVVICTGHNWPLKNEGETPGYFDSPYPPAKLNIKTNEPVAIKGSSLTAIDAVRTLARANGGFSMDDQGVRHFKLDDDSHGFKMIMHSRDGLLPGLRFHLEDPQLSKEGTLTKAQFTKHREANHGFISLDYVFEENFKHIIRKKHPEFYELIRAMSMEDFVELMMGMREHVEPFHLFHAEYIEAERSIHKHESVYWKELLAILSFSMNYPAKYFSAEDHMRLQKHLMPLISIVIAFIPQSAAEEIMALHQLGLLEIVAVGHDSHVEPGTERGATYHYLGKAVHFNTFVDSTGQPHLAFEDLPFKSLLEKHSVSPARLRFRSADVARQAETDQQNTIETDTQGNYYLRVPGIAINDNYQPVDKFGAMNERIYMMAVPYIGGFNPDYSGLDFCEAASQVISKSILQWNNNR